jgi:hypothetical protein
MVKLCVYHLHLLYFQVSDIRHCDEAKFNRMRECAVIRYALYTAFNDSFSRNDQLEVSAMYASMHAKHCP